MDARQQAQAEALRAEGKSFRNIATAVGTTYRDVREWFHSQHAVALPPEDGPAILVYDIETAPALVWTWAQFETNVVGTEQDWYMLSFAYRWLGSSEAHFVAIKQDPTFRPDSDNDRWVAERLRDLFDLADVVVAHNGDKFDQKKAAARFLVHELDPPSPFVSIDTVKESRRHFNHYAHSLNELARLLGLDTGLKVAHPGFKLWRDCMAGDADAWALMEAYNVQDVAILEVLYHRLVPYMGTPGKAAAPFNAAHWAPGGAMVCPKCGSARVQKRGTHRTRVTEFQTYQCQDCKGYSRARKREPQRNGGVSLV